MLFLLLFQLQNLVVLLGQLLVERFELRAVCSVVFFQKAVGVAVSSGSQRSDQRVSNFIDRREAKKIFNRPFTMTPFPDQGTLLVLVISIFCRLM